MCFCTDTHYPLLPRMAFSFQNWRLECSEDRDNYGLWIARLLYSPLITELSNPPTLINTAKNSTHLRACQMCLEQLPDLDVRQELSNMCTTILQVMDST